MGWSDIATWVGIAVAGGVGVLGLMQSSKANRHSAAALELAQAADEREARADRVRRERQDIQWRTSWDPEQDTFWVENIGSEPAHAVKLWADFDVGPDAPRELETAPIVGPRDRIGLNLAGPADAAREAARAANGAAERRSNQILDMQMMPSFAATVGISWESDAGVPEVLRWRTELLSVRD